MLEDGMTVTAVVEYTRVGKTIQVSHVVACACEWSFLAQRARRRLALAAAA